MADRTSNTTFDEQADPMFLAGLTNASNTDTFVLPKKFKTVLANSEDDNDAIVSAQLASDGTTVTIGAVDDAGANITVDFDIYFLAIG